MNGLMGLDSGRGLFLDIGNSRMTVAEEAEAAATKTRPEARAYSMAQEAVSSEGSEGSKTQPWSILDSIPLSPSPDLSAKTLIDLLQQQPSHRPIIAASVRQDITDQLAKTLPERIHWIRREHFRPFISTYETPNTLGLDRILTAWGAWNHHQQPAIIIDCGTACTIDAISISPTKTPLFQGGVIMPGIRTLHASLRQATPELPPVPLSIPATFPGKSTQSCLEWGLNGFFADGVIAHIHRFREQAGSMPILLTGGDADLLSHWFDSFGLMGHHTDPYLIFRGMRQLPEQL